MKKLSIISYLNLVLFTFCFPQEPFLVTRPYTKPSFEQYPVANSVDHHHPYTNEHDGLFHRFDGYQYTGNVIFPNCLSGSSCYDGHAGIDYYMPLNTPILAPADGYVTWASFSPAADPCPGGITPNGNQGTIHIAHPNGYFTVYLHMNPPLNVSVGQAVSAGDTLGFNGNTGCAVNAHLHFEIRKGSHFFDTVNPYAVDPFGWWDDSTDPIEQFHDNRSQWLWVSDSIVDDGDNGFQRFSGPDWNYFDGGYNNDYWAAPITNSSSNGRHYSIWVPTILDSGEYDIKVFIPAHANATDMAKYEFYVRENDGTSNKTEILVDQSSFNYEFRTIHTMPLPKGNRFGIMLRNIVPEQASGNYVVFDAIKVSPVFSSSLSKSDNAEKPNIELISASPNPFNSNIEIAFHLIQESRLYIHVYDIAGSLVLEDQFIGNDGKNIFRWNGKNTTGSAVPSGIYFIKINNQKAGPIRRVLFIK